MIVHVREQLLDSNSKATAIVSGKYVLVGMGGIGKTSFAKWYATEYQDDYDHIIWINSEGASLSNSFQRLGKTLGLQFDSNSGDTLPELCQDIYEKLRELGCLFVFDNAERLRGENGLGKLLPKNELHHSIITSRNHDWGSQNEFGQIPTFQLNVFTKAECIRLLRSTLEPLGKAGSEDMLALGTELGFLPLALQCAVCTILKSKYYTLATYTERIRQDLKILMDKTILSEYERPISATLNLSIEQIEKDEDIDEECRDWCKIISYVTAYCEPDDIPQDLLLGLGSIENRNLLTEALDVLITFSIISHREEQDPDSGVILKLYGIHRLLQLFVRHKARIDSECAVRAIKLAFACILPAMEHTPVGLVTFGDHARHMWKHACTQLNEILTSCHEVPLAISRNELWADNFEFVSDAVHNLKRVFKDTDLPILRLKFRLICMLTSRDVDRAKEMFDELQMACESSDSGRISHWKQLNLHLRIVGLGMESRRRRRRVNTTVEETNLLLEYDRISKSARALGYDGVVEGKRLCCYSDYGKDLDLRASLEIDIANLLVGVGQVGRAIEVLAALLNDDSLEMRAMSLHAVLSFVEVFEKLMDALMPIIFQKLLTQKEETPRSFEHDAMFKITATCVRWTVKKKKTLEPEQLLDVLEFVNERFSVDQHIGETIPLFIQGTQNFLDLGKDQPQNYDRMFAVCEQTWQKLVYLISHYRTGSFRFGTPIIAEHFAELHLLTTIYSCALIDKRPEELVKLDNCFRTFLDDTKYFVDWESFHTPIFYRAHKYEEYTEDLPLKAYSNFVTALEGTNIAEHNVKQILESKLSTSLYIIRQSTDAFIVYRKLQTTPLSSIMTNYDQACYALVRLGRLEEATTLWLEGLEFATRDGVLNLVIVSQVGKSVLKFLEQTQQIVIFKKFMEMLGWYVDGNVGRLEEGDWHKVDEVNDHLEDITALVVRLNLCGMEMQAMSIIRTMKQYRFFVDDDDDDIFRIFYSEEMDTELESNVELMKAKLKKFLYDL